MSAETRQHPSYVAIWVVLLIALFVSVALGSMGNVVLATALIFGIATFKAYLVAAYYMGLKWEARYVTAILLVGIAFMLILYFGLTPDIRHGYGK
ncbi:MAG TPA: cytochrome C oxidase subunit IV family protein [bacterium]|nr:cytochrome C oxidase subunit IV family protein [bacterium]